MSKFTVKVRDSVAMGEGESLFSCDHIEVIWPSSHKVAASSDQQSNWDQAGIYLDPEPTPAANDKGYTLFAKHVILFGGDHTSTSEKRKGGKVWVMNEAGSTVATYDL